MSRLTLRAAGAAALGATAGIHLYLYQTGYSEIPTIGWLFLANVVGASVLCLAVLATPGRWGALVALAGAGLEALTAIGLIVTQQRGLFGFAESTTASLFWPSLWVEAAGTVVLVAAAAVGWFGFVAHRSGSPVVAGR